MPFYEDTTMYPVSTFKTFPLFFKSHSKSTHSHKNTPEHDSEPFLVDTPTGLSVRRRIPLLSSDFSQIMYYQNKIEFKQTLFVQS
jgi:hypothetical protein